MEMAHRSTTGEGRAFWLKMAAHWNENQTSQYKAADCGKAMALAHPLVVAR
jgi:hypothetical protein